MSQVVIEDAEASTLAALTAQLLEWIGARPRTYGDAMEAWRTSCPRMPVWENAVSGGLVTTAPGDVAGMNGRAVRVTPLGRALLAAAARAANP